MSKPVHSLPNFFVFVCLCRQETSTYTNPLAKQVIDKPITVPNYSHITAIVLSLFLIFQNMCCSSHIKPYTAMLFFLTTDSTFCTTYRVSVCVCVCLQTVSTTWQMWLWTLQPVGLLVSKPTFVYMVSDSVPSSICCVLRAWIHQTCKKTEKTFSLK